LSLKDKTPVGILCVLACEVLWGFSFMFTKAVTDSVSPLALLSWRFIVAFVVLSLCALLRIVKLDFRNKSLRSLLLLAIFMPACYFIGETVGIKLTSASESGAIIACIPIGALLLSTWMLKEPPTKLQVTGVGVTTAGIILIILMKGLGATLNPLGYLMLLVAVVSYGLYSVYAQKTHQFSSAEKTYAMMALGAIVFTCLALGESIRDNTLRAFVTLPFTNHEFLAAILYLGIGCSVVAFLLYNIALTSIGTNRTSSFAGLATLVAILAGVVILKEGYSVAQSAGTVLVIGGVYLANITHAKQVVVDPETEY
jgi:drug/metabolite transporter (DMT)-like permease